MKSLDDWREKGGHLPKFMRDFHDQKRVFKWLNRAAQKQNANLEAYEQHPDFRQAMIYTIDIFLWIMAAHGYTLQPTRQKIEGLGDLDGALSRFQKEWDEFARQSLTDAIAERSQALAPQDAQP